MSRYFLFTAMVLFVHIEMLAQPQGPQPNYHFVRSNSIVASKNYYLLTLLQQDKAARQLIASDTTLTGVFNNKIQQLERSLTDCKDEVDCFSTAISFTDAEIALVSDRLAMLYQPGNALGKLVQQHLIPSGTYILFQQADPKELLVKAWQQDAHGINFTIAVYAAGKKPNYPNIDSISFNVKANGYPRLLYSMNYLLINECKDSALFFLPSMTAALHLLEINERDDAAAFEPMAAGENKAAADRIKTTQWNTYTYSVILIPGAGPDEPAVALSAEGMIRCRLAAIQYRKGLAPFIVVSGGKVHPYKTKYCEATEMKKYMVATLHIPAAAIIIDPHARHTTTNMRNTVRMMYRYGMPFSKPGITCTTRGQSHMIETTLVARCMKELNEAPYKNGRRLSETETEFYPLLEALHINPMEPMDP